MSKRVAIVLPDHVEGIDDTQRAFGPLATNLHDLVIESEMIEIDWPQSPVYPDAFAALRREPAPTIADAVAPVSPASGDLDNFTRGYLEAALWASSADDGCPLDRRYSLSDFDISTKAKARELCERFMAENASTLDLYCEKIETPDGDEPMAYAGHDLWLTRNGEGAGFWDRGLADIGEKLTDEARKLGEANVWEITNGLEIS